MKKSGGAVYVKAHTRAGKKVRAYTRGGGSSKPKSFVSSARAKSGGIKRDLTKPSEMVKSQKKTMKGMTKEGKLAFLRAEAERATERMMKY